MFTEIIYDGSDMGFNFPVPVNEVIVFKTIKQWQLRKGPYTTGLLRQACTFAQTAAMSITL